MQRLLPSPFCVGVTHVFRADNFPGRSEDGTFEFRASVVSRRLYETTERSTLTAVALPEAAKNWSMFLNLTKPPGIIASIELSGSTRYGMLQYTPSGSKGVINAFGCSQKARTIC